MTVLVMIDPPELELIVHHTTFTAASKGYWICNRMSEVRSRKHENARHLTSNLYYPRSGISYKLSASAICLKLVLQKTKTIC